MNKKNKKNKTTKQASTKTPNTKKLSSVAEVWSEEESSVTVEKTRELALPESTTPFHWSPRNKDEQGSTI